MILSITGELERKCQLPLGQGEKGKKLKQILVVPIYSSNTKSKKSKLQPKKKKATKDFIHISHTIKTHRILHIKYILLQQNGYTESGYKPNIFEVFMLKSTPGCNSSAGIEAEHFLEHDTEMLNQ